MKNLVSATEMLVKARKEGYAVAQLNINNADWAKVILEVCEEMKSPVILGVSEGACKYIGGYNTVYNVVSGLIQDLGITVPVSIHLDHGTYEGAKKAMAANWPSVMFDGSHYPFEENVAKTTEIIKEAHAKGISVEAEVGSIAGEEDGVTGTGEVASPEECAKITELGVDFLAAGIGNIHGAYPENWQGLNFEVLEEISKVTNEIPLVLHGGSGIPDDMVKKSIALGVAKINVNSEKQWAFAEGVAKYFEEGKHNEKKGFDPRKIIGAGMPNVRQVIKEKIELFGSANKA